jgi:hypothetical protein
LAANSAGVEDGAIYREAPLNDHIFGLFVTGRTYPNKVTYGGPAAPERNDIGHRNLYGFHDIIS